MVWATALMLAAAPVPELLVCKGSTVAPVAIGSSSAIFTDNRGNVAAGSVVDSEVREVAAVVQFRLNGQDPRANIPAFFAPELSSSKGGWYRVKDLEISEVFIRGKVVFNFIESSRFEIDRRTGAMTSRRGFQAMCEAADVSGPKF